MSYRRKPGDAGREIAPGEGQDAPCRRQPRRLQDLGIGRRRVRVRRRPGHAVDQGRRPVQPPGTAVGQHGVEVVEGVPGPLVVQGPFV